MGLVSAIPVEDVPSATQDVAAVSGREGPDEEVGEADCVSRVQVEAPEPEQHTTASGTATVNVGMSLDEQHDADAVKTVMARLADVLLRVRCAAYCCSFGAHSTLWRWA